MLEPHTTRRNFMVAAAGSALVPFAADLMNSAQPQDSQGVPDVGFAVRKLRPLPYDELPGFLSKAQLSAHHGAHYAGALKSLVEIEGKLESADRKTANANYSDYRALRREQVLTMNSVVLHELYFTNLGANAAPPAEAMKKAIEARFGTFDRWREDFTACAMACRGWAILAHHGGDNRLYNIVSDAHDVGLIWQGTPLLVADLYEHAYYVDYQNKKAAYVEALHAHLDWAEVEKRFRKVIK